MAPPVTFTYEINGEALVCWLSEITRARTPHRSLSCTTSFALKDAPQFSPLRLTFSPGAVALSSQGLGRGVVRHGLLEADLLPRGLPLGLTQRFV